MDITWLVGIAKGLGMGAGQVLIGYIKNLPDGASFDFVKATPAIVIGGITGAVAFTMGIPMNDAGSLIATFGVVAIVNSLWSGFLKWRANRPKSPRKANK